jgi:type IV fimbrial biogenesis protein FimT
MRARHGFTLVELMIVIAVVSVLLLLAAPSFVDFIRVQRLKAINAQLVTDLHFARSEALSRNHNVQVAFGTPPADGAGLSCYTIYVDTNVHPIHFHPIHTCDCTQPPGPLRCPAGLLEIRTVQIAPDQGVRLRLPPAQANSFAFMHAHGQLSIGGVTLASRLNPFVVETSLDATRRLRNVVAVSGRPTTCAPGGAVPGVSAC